MRLEFNYDNKYILHEIDKTENTIIVNPLLLYTEYTDYEGYDTQEAFCSFSNENEKDSKVLRDVYICHNESCPECRLIYSNGDNCEESGYETFERKLTQEDFIIAPTQGSSCNGAFPYFRVLYEGGGYNIAVGWPGQWETSLSYADGKLNIKVRQQRLNTYIRPNERVRVPRLTFMSFKGDEADGINKWRAWFKKYMLPKDIKAMFMLANRAGGIEFTQASEKNQLDAIDTFISRGITPDVWWIDAGWYKCDGDWTRTGSWKPDRDRFPEGFKNISRKCRENGIRFLLWFEPERVMKDSLIDKTHPEYMLKYTDDNGNVSDTRILDLGNRECAKWWAELANNMIKENGIDIYRQDANLYPLLKYWLQAEETAREGMKENLYIQGLLYIYDEIKRCNKDIIIDNCSSGGRRNDMELMRRAVPLHYTDVGYGIHPLKQTQYTMMFKWLPYFKSSAFNWDLTDGSYASISPFDPFKTDEFAYYNCITAFLEPRLDVDAPEEEFMLARRMLPIWRKTADILVRGDYYALSDPHKNPGEYYACQFEYRATGEGFIQIIRNTKTERESITLKLHIDEECIYTFNVAGTNEVFNKKSEDLQYGFTCAIPKRSSVIYFYTRTKQE